MSQALNTKHRSAVADRWQNDSFMSEMESRYNYYKNGGKMVTAEEANRQIKELLKKQTKKK